MKTIVLGDGLNGLIFGFYNPDFDVRSLGEHTRPPMDDMVVLHDTPETRKLLEDLKLPVVPKTKAIRYYFNGKEYPLIPEPVLTEYVLKKVGGRRDMIDKDRTLSQAGPLFSYLDVKISDVESRLREEVPIIPMVIGDLPKIPPALIISTLPAHVFWGKYPGHRPPGLELLSNPSTYVVREKAPPEMKEDFAWAYFADEHSYHRVGHCHENYVYEYAGKPDTFKYEVDGSEVQMMGISNAVIRSDPHNHPPPGYLFCGRHATWKHWWKLQHTVRMATQRFTWERLWHRQAWFETFHLDMSREVDELTDDTIYYMTCLQGELHEMLRELQWKRWKRGERLNRQRVLEEFVDSLKFMVTLGVLWNFTPEEVFAMFEEKSNRVEEGYFNVQRP